MTGHPPIKKNKINQAYMRRPGIEGPHILAIFSLLLFFFQHLILYLDYIQI
jgi:hypothetical protein